MFDIFPRWSILFPILLFLGPWSVSASTLIEGISGVNRNSASPSQETLGSTITGTVSVKHDYDWSDIPFPDISSLPDAQPIAHGSCHSVLQGMTLYDKEVTEVCVSQDGFLAQRHPTKDTEAIGRRPGCSGTSDIGGLASNEEGLYDYTIVSSLGCYEEQPFDYCLDQETHSFVPSSLYKYEESGRVVFQWNNLVDVNTGLCRSFLLGMTLDGIYFGYDKPSFTDILPVAGILSDDANRWSAPREVMDLEGGLDVVAKWEHQPISIGYYHGGRLSQDQLTIHPFEPIGLAEPRADDPSLYDFSWNTSIQNAGAGDYTLRFCTSSSNCQSAYATLTEPPLIEENLLQFQTVEFQPLQFMIKEVPFIELEPPPEIPIAEAGPSPTLPSPPETGEGPADCSQMVLIAYDRKGKKELGTTRPNADCTYSLDFDLPTAAMDEKILRLKLFDERKPDILLKGIVDLDAGIFDPENPSEMTIPEADLSVDSTNRADFIDETLEALGGPDESDAEIGAVLALSEAFDEWMLADEEGRRMAADVFGTALNRLDPSQIEALQEEGMARFVIDHLVENWDGAEAVFAEEIADYLVDSFEKIRSEHERNGSAGGRR